MLRERLEALLVTMLCLKEVQAFKSFGAYQQAVEAVVSVCRRNVRECGLEPRPVSEAKAKGPESVRR